MAMLLRRAPEQADRAEITNVDVEPEPASTVEFDRPDILETDIEIKRKRKLNYQLRQAASQGNFEEINKLVAQGADVNSIDQKDGRTALHKACSSGLGMVSQRVTDTLVRHGAATDERDFMGDTPLLLACLTGEESAIPILIHAGANVNAAHNNGSTPLHITAQQGKAAIMEILIRGGALVDVQNNAGRTPLHELAIAGAEGSEEAAELLLDSGAFVDMMDYWGNTPLHLSALGKRVGVVEILLRYEASVNTKNSHAETALHEASRLDFGDGVEVLLRNGADAGITDNKGMTAVQIATGRRLANIVALINRYSSTADAASGEDQPSGEEESSEEEESNDPHPDDFDFEPTPFQRSEQPDEEQSSQAQLNAELPNAVVLPEIPSNTWTGVRRDNGDGFILANYDNHDISFDAKLESILPCVHEGKDMHEIQLLINFMRPYSMDHRIRYAKVDVMLSPSDPKDTPHIRGIMPQADRMEVSDQEITSGQKFTVGAAGNGGPSSVNISMEGSKSRTSTFKGVRIIHGAIKDRMHACWRMYEEPGSKSGLPEIVRLLMLTHCDSEFEIRLNLSVKACHFLTFGIPRTLTAPPGPSYLVPNLRIIYAMEQESRLRQMLDVADRAATVVEEANTFETRFSHAIRHHAKKDLIMQAGMKESYLQEWTDILDASKSSDFRILREKLLEMRDPESPRIIHGNIRLDRTERMWSPSDAQLRLPRERARVPRRRPADSPEDLWYSNRAGDRRREEYGYNPRSRNALQGFSAVGPGYHVSRLA
ncbi:ankyrin repeat-containing domain protein [Aspergillus spectabilis]